MATTAKPRMVWDGERTSGLLVVEREDVTVWTWTNVWTPQTGRVAVAVIA